MNKIILFLFILIINISISEFLFENTFGQEIENISPWNQWKQLPDPDILTCKVGFILIQKTSGIPACVSPSTFIKLVDRGYGKFDSSQLMKRPDMMNHLMSGMVNDSQLMHHWHTMMLNDPKIMQQRISDIILDLKENPEHLTNILAPMTSNPELREQMIGQMKNHPQMMNSFNEHSGWMNSVHQPVMDSNMGQKIGNDTHSQVDCDRCTDIPPQNLASHQVFQQPKIMEDMMHYLWVNENMQNKMQNLMLENPSHMSKMLGIMMEPILGQMMDEPEIREQMIDMMLEHHDFMNSIRHENRFN